MFDFDALDECESATISRCEAATKHTYEAAVGDACETATSEACEAIARDIDAEEEVIDAEEEACAFDPLELLGGMGDEQCYQVTLMEEAPQLPSEMKPEELSIPSKPLTYDPENSSTLKHSPALTRAEAGEYYTTICRVLMREGEELTSGLIGHVPPNSLMVVLDVPLKQNSRRIKVCVEQGVQGWVSLSKQTGEALLRSRSVSVEEEENLKRAVQKASSVNMHAPPGKGSPVLCDKCDGPHATDCCPFFKKAREDHKDAWAHYGDRNPHKMGSAGGNFILRSAYVVPQPGDGSCLFHSLCYGLSAKSRVSSSAQQLRRDIAEFIAAHPQRKIAGDTIEEWVQWDQNTSAATYAKRMALSGWGGGIEMACFSVMQGMNVHVYEATKDVQFKRISCFDVPHPRATIHVLYQGGVHYDALVPLGHGV
jgi:hypothetical protein